MNHVENQAEISGALGGVGANQKVAQQILAKAGGKLSHCHMVA